MQIYHLTLIIAYLHHWRVSSRRHLTFMKWYERIQSSKDMAQLALGHDFKLQHWLVVHLADTPPRQQEVQVRCGTESTLYVCRYRVGSIL
jgi:hypothetical protein